MRMFLVMALALADLPARADLLQEPEPVAAAFFGVIDSCEGPEIRVTAPILGEIGERWRQSAEGGAPYLGFRCVPGLEVVVTSPNAEATWDFSRAARVRPIRASTPR